MARRVAVCCAVVCLAVALGAAPTMAEPSGPSAPGGTSAPGGPSTTSRRCAIALGLLPAATGVARGNTSSTARQARILRKLADRKHIPRLVKRSLGVMAQWFDDARDRGLADRTRTLAALAPAVGAIVRWSKEICPASVTATSTTLPSTTVPSTTAALS